MFNSQTAPRPTPAAWRVPAVGRTTCLCSIRYHGILAMLIPPIYRSSRRRNGKLASCEPCRKDKCLLGFIIRSQQHAGTGPSSESRITSRRLGSRISVLLHAGYLGPINSIIDDGDGINSHGHSDGSEAQSSSFSCFNSFQEVEELLECLREFPCIKGYMNGYYTLSQVAVVPAPFIRRALAEIEVTYDAITVRSPPQPLSELATTIVKNTRQPFDVAQECDGVRFHESFTGSSIRLEVLGLIYALAGRAISFGFPYNFSHSQDSACSPLQFSRICSLQAILLTNSAFSRF
ncbi:hypothetical protein BDQ94DRAFT_184255 [Aspergillus welwitschiae]|uniref:Uncharacterized protein n=1 Tax=Aspergillus welwitschiae TaxID=1341132 RepID=A0A3F3PLN0_9EURO|nr:hypothetical protein BDQ94DRAFT_184255 [Aspergillus welwitschiae]RDH27840.1 hypothetical protein BDQ94DRAFT_184255 [Aspergillus welwitschiae]